MTTGNLNKAVNRNITRFPDNFRFRLTSDEHEKLLFQNGRANRQGGRKTLPYVFTEQGVAMISGVLRSDRAAEINVLIMRTFVHMRKILATHDDIVQKINQNDHHIKRLYAHVEKLLKLPDPQTKPIGYIVPVEEKK